tara:strand:+ start:908 stop:2767 length:1860 start_codon:yes stop_codon:yes gene_type:complete
MNRFILLCCLVFFCNLSQASTVTATPELEQIAALSTWKKLLVYSDNGQSYIMSDHFFLSEIGNTDPLSELRASLAAFSAPVNEAGPDNHAQCKFAARFNWLKRHVNISDFGITEIECPEFSQFLQQQNVNSISVIFASGFLGNPASYYGHLLLKLNTGNVGSQQNMLQDTAINYGADVPPDENMALYVIKGIVGQYDASFTQQKYFYHAENYGESELRDLWEYELALEPQDITLLLGHLWELLDADYQYYFFNRNCAFHMGELLQLLIDTNVTSSKRLWITPQSIMQNLSTTTYKGRSLVKEIRYHPSRQSRLYQRFSLLNRQQKNVLFDLVKQPELLANTDLSQFKLTEQHQIIDTLIDYYQFLRKESVGSADPNNNYYKQAVLLRYQLPAGQSANNFNADSQPHLGRKPSYSAIHLAHSADENYGQLQLRPAYYDALDAANSHVRFSALSMGELILGFTNTKLFLKDFSLLKIENIRANYTGLPGDQNYSWYLDVGAIQSKVGCVDCEAFKANTGIGYGFEALSAFNISGFVGVGYLGDKIDSAGGYLSTRLISTWYISGQVSSRFEFERRFFNGGMSDHLAKLNVRYAVSQDSDFRITVNKDRHSTELGLVLGWYW